MVTHSLQANFTDIKEYLTNLYKKVMETKETVETRIQEEIDSREDVNVQEIYANLTIRGIESFSQSAQVRKLWGIRVDMFSRFLDNFERNLDLEKNMKEQLRKKLSSFVNNTDKNWRKFEFIFSNNSTNKTRHISILSQRDINDAKINWVSTDIETKMNLTDVFLMKNTTTFKNGTMIEELQIVKKPVDMDEEDLKLIMDFFEICALKAFGNTFGTEEEEPKFLAFLDEVNKEEKKPEKKEDGGKKETIWQTFGHLTDLAKSLVNTWGETLKFCKNSRTNSFKEKLVSKGFTYFHQVAGVQVGKGLEANNLDLYLDSLMHRIKMPKERQEELKYALQDVKLFDTNVWAVANTLFDIGTKGDSKFVSIFYHKNTEGKYDFIISDLQTTFQLAPNILVVNKKLSILGGIWDDTQDIFDNIPREFTQDDMKSIISFFQVVTFKAVMDNLGIKGYEFPEIVTEEKK